MTNDEGPLYAECPTTTYSIEIAAPRSAVWNYAIDVNLPATFSTEFQGAHWLDGATGPATGARFVGSNAHESIGTWQTTCTIVEFDPGAAFAWAVEDPSNPTATWRFTLEDSAAGTRLTQSAQIGPGPSGLTTAIERFPDKERRIVSRRLAELHANMQRTCEGIRTLAETAQ